VLRNEAPGCATSIFQAVHLALPPLLRRIEPAANDPPPTKSPKPKKRRLEPRQRSATSKSKNEIMTLDQ
jgi:hypothetical protein